MLLIIVPFHPLYPESPSGTIPNSSHSNPENHSVNLFQYFQTVATEPPPTCRPFPLQVFRCTSLLPTLSSSLFPSKPMKNGLVPLFSEPSLGDGNNGARTHDLSRVRRTLIPAELCFHIRIVILKLWSGAILNAFCNKKPTYSASLSILQTMDLAGIEPASKNPSHVLLLS